MNKIIKIFLGIDLFVGLTLVTTYLTKLLFEPSNGYFIVLAIAFAFVNAIVTLITCKKINFYKNVNEYVKK